MGRQASLIAGVSVDYSPAAYFAEYIDVDRDAGGYFTGYTPTDSVLTDYRAGLLNTAAYLPGANEPAGAAETRFGALRFRPDGLQFRQSPAAFRLYRIARMNAIISRHGLPKLGLAYDFGSDRGHIRQLQRGVCPAQYFRAVPRRESARC